MTTDLYPRICKPSVIKNAARTVLEKALKSSSEEIRNDAVGFKENFDGNVKKILKKLKEKTFQFEKSKGVPIKREGKTPRPIVISSLEDRVVRRAILDVLQKQRFIKKFLTIKTSFGGVSRPDAYSKKRKKEGGLSGGVPEAIEAAVKTFDQKNTYYIRSDIINFFQCIPKDAVLQKIKPYMDSAFYNLLNQATTVELKNQEDLKEYRDLFPSTERGVSQGCSLSPLIGNILLYEFDAALNKNGITCLRYIDDFIIIGSTQQKVQIAFNIGLGILKKYGLTAHSTFNKPDGKSACGLISKGVEFLGIEMTNGMIQPAKSARNKLIENIKDILKESRKKKFKAEVIENDKFVNYSYLETLNKVSRKVTGWGKQYKFCNNKSAMLDLDRKIIKMVNDYTHSFLGYYQSLKDEEEKANIYSLKPLTSCIEGLIIWPTKIKV